MPPSALTCIIVLVCFGYAWHRFFRKKGLLPPGPPPLPLIGNIHQLPIYNPWKRLAKWHEEYGPVITFNVGSFPVVVVGSLETCHEIFDDRGRIYSSRLQLKSLLYADIGTRCLLHEMLDSKDASQVLTRFAPNLVSLLAYGEPVQDWAMQERFDNIFVVGIESLSMGSAVVDILPALDWLPGFIAPWRSRANRQGEELSWEGFCFTTGELFMGASITTSMSLGVFQIGSDELDRVIGADRLPQMEDLRCLPYVCAFTKEILRWRPLLPLGPPHSVTEDDEYCGYFIPAGTPVMGNIWAIQMDSATFPDPEAFRPERWIENPDLPLAVFGFGRRICPGQHVVNDQIAITVARLLRVKYMNPKLRSRPIEAA
ncbi:cytochrome P450 [Aspergillus oleicola]